MKKAFCLIHIRNGEVTNPQSVRKMFAELKEKDGRYKLEAEAANKRSLPQNAYLHAVLIPEFKNALNSVGYNEVKTNDQAKQIMKSMFLQSEIVNENTGEIIRYIKDTHDLTTIEMAALIEEVIQFAAENMNYEIPYPNEQLQIFH